VRLGIRPEHLRLEPQTGSGRIPATVEVVEPLGYDTHVTCRCGQDRFIVRAGGHGEWQMDERVYLEMDPAGVRCFDARTGERL
jgi:ABC-type sugar transport system ATPase subunit